MGLPLVAESPVSHCSSASVQSQGAAAEVLVDDALAVLPRLSRGLDVNASARGRIAAARVRVEH
jgi:hypothetical protein